MAPPKGAGKKRNKMAHMIEALDVNATLAGSDRAWHKLDAQYDFPSMTEQAIAAALGLDHAVSLVNLSRADTGLQLANTMGIISEKLPDVPMQVVGERFKLVQPSEFFAWTYNVIGELGASIVSGGTLKSTRHGFVCAELPNTALDLGGGDTLKKFIFFGISWDGSYPIVCMLNDIRTVCWNTTPSLEALDRAGDNRLFYQKRHGLLNGAATKATVEAFRSLQASGRARAQEILGRLVGTQYDTVNPQTLLRFASVMADGKAVLDRIVSLDQVNSDASFLDRCINATIDLSAWSKVRTAGMSNRGTRIVAETMNGLGASLETSRGTLWGALNGYTYWTDHLEGRTEEGRSEDVIFGGRAQEKQNAVLLLSAIANTPAALGN